LKIKIPYWPLLIGPLFLYYLGAFFNVGVIALNHGQMPVLLPAMPDTGFDERHQLMTAATHLKFFCDWINLGDGVASIGDLLLWASNSIATTCAVLWATMMIKDFNERG
jgi:hypothetical protein